jgi:hypothetical protein
MEECTTPFRPPHGVKIEPINPIPTEYQHPHNLGMERWGDDCRMVADPQMIVDHNAFAANVLDRLSALEREKKEQSAAEREAKEYHEVMCISAEVVRALEHSFLTKVFGVGYSREGITMHTLLHPGSRSSQVTSVWLPLRQQRYNNQRFGSDEDFCRLLSDMKVHAQHHPFRPRRHINDLTTYVLRCCGMYYDRKSAVIESSATLSMKEKRDERAKYLLEKDWFGRKIGELMQLVREEVGEYPFGSPESETP